MDTRQSRRDIENWVATKARNRKMIQRGPVQFQRRAKRPIDKQLISILVDSTNAQSTTVLDTFTFPGTITGLRWDIDYTMSTDATLIQGVWAIVIARDGDTPNTLVLTNGSSMYQPETHVLAFGAWVGIKDANGMHQVHWNDSTKSMRKVQAGDTLNFITLANIGTSGDLSGVIQFFLKT